MYTLAPYAGHRSAEFPIFGIRRQRTAPLNSLLVQGARYAVIGLSNVTLDLVLLNVGVFVTHITRGPVLIGFATVAFLAALANGYYWNCRWTFNVEIRLRQQLPVFAAVTLVSVALNDGVIYLLTATRHVWIGESPALHVNEAKAMAIFVTAIWNFFAFRGVVLRVS